MFGFIEKIFLTGLTVLSSLVSTTTLNCKNMEYCTLCYFQYSLQLALVFILFITNTRIVIKKMFLNMVMFIKQKIINHIKWKK